VKTDFGQYHRVIHTCRFVFHEVAMRCLCRSLAWFFHGSFDETKSKSSGSQLVWTPGAIILCIKLNDAPAPYKNIFTDCKSWSCLWNKMRCNVWNGWAHFSFDAYLRAILCFITAIAEKPASHKYEVAIGIKILKASLDAKWM